MNPRNIPYTLPVLMACGLLLAGCDDQAAPAATAVSAPAEQARPQDPNVITPSASLRQRLTVAPLERGVWRDIQRVPGTVRLDEQRMARIGSAVSGRVSSILVQPGDTVRRGDVLAMLNSPELADAQLAYLKALSGRHLKAREVQRARSLVDSGVISEAELQRRENDLDEVSFDVSALADRLRVLGMSQQAIDTLASTRRIDSSAPLTASLDGTVIERKIAPGQVLQATDDAFTVADLGHVWVVAEIPEQAAAHLSVGQKVEISFPALGEDTPRKGELIYVSATVNPQTRTIAVRSDVDNADRRLKPDMLALMVIQGEGVERPIIPDRAVVRENNADFVFVQQPDGAFRLTPVTLGAERNDQRPVLDGLRDGESIVVDGAFHLNNERRRQELE